MVACVLLNISIHVHVHIDRCIISAYMYMYSHGNPVTDVILAMDYDSLAPPGDPLPVRGGSVATPD